MENIEIFNNRIIENLKVFNNLNLIEHIKLAEVHLKVLNITLFNAYNFCSIHGFYKTKSCRKCYFKSYHKIKKQKTVNKFIKVKKMVDININEFNKFKERLNNRKIIRTRNDNEIDVEEYFNSFSSLPDRVEDLFNDLDPYFHLQIV